MWWGNRGSRTWGSWSHFICSWEAEPWLPGTSRSQPGSWQMQWAGPPTSAEPRSQSGPEVHLVKLTVEINHCSFILASSCFPIDLCFGNFSLHGNTDHLTFSFKAHLSPLHHRLWLISSMLNCPFNKEAFADIIARGTPFHLLGFTMSPTTDRLYSVGFVDNSYVCECLPACAHVCPQRPESSIRSASTAVTDKCDPPCWCSKLNLGSQQEQ